ncbi:MAG TPA: GDSL-type esterase/lipase family protein [Pseudolysinimonas sp.]|nr:GDSL-type esterase/lipase family protein [Pseudolysinimonas sp.]
MTHDTHTWQTAWTQAVTDIRGMAPETHDVTLRFTVPIALTGSHVRFTLSNQHGTTAIRIGSAAAVLGDASVQATFSGELSAEVAPGGELTSDPIDIHTTAGDELAIDLYLPEPTPHATGNLAGLAWVVSERGDHAGDLNFPAPPPALVEGPGGTSYMPPAPLLRNIEISGANAQTIVACLGDSITAAGWPNKATALLQGTGVIFLNRGLAGNRLREDGAGWAGAFFGRAGLTRFDDDVLNTSGVTHSIIALGTNDLGHPGSPSAPNDTVPTFEDLTASITDLIRRCQSAGISPTLATITPFTPAEGYDPAREQTRGHVNDWIRSHPHGAAVLDFAEALQSPTNPTALASQYDSGDHLHPNDAGQSRLAEEAATAFRA